MYIFYNTAWEYIPETLDLNILCGIIPTHGKALCIPEFILLGIYLKRFVYDIDLTTIYSTVDVCIYFSQFTSFLHVILYALLL